MGEKELRGLLRARLHMELQLFKDSMLQKGKEDIFKASYRIEIYVDLYEILLVHAENLQEGMARELLGLGFGILDHLYRERMEQNMVRLLKADEIECRVAVIKENGLSLLLYKDARVDYNGKYAVSSIVYCAHCGDIYRRIKWNNRGYKSIVWRCVSRVEKGGPDCTARTVREDELHRAVLTAMNDVLNRKDSFLPILKENIVTVLGEDITGKVEEIDKEMQEILTEAALKKDTRDRIEDMMRFLDDQICEVTEYSETLTRRLIEKVMVYDEKMVVEFKSGLQIEVDA